MNRVRIVNNVRIGIDHMTKAMAQDARDIMKRHAPHPEEKDVGPGSESTGALKKSIHYWKINDETYIIGPAGNTIGNDGLKIGEYAGFANKGRGPVYPKRAKSLVFYPNHPKYPNKDNGKVVTRRAGPMEGWEYVDKTIQDLDKNLEDGKYKMFE